MHVIAADRPVGPLTPCLQRFPRRLGRDQAVAAAADQVRAAGLLQGVADLEIVLRLEELQERPLQLAVAQVAGDEDLLAAERVDAGVVHARRHVERLVSLHIAA